MDNLALELIDQIIDQMDPHARKALSLVSHVFVAPVQRRIFKLLKLSDKNGVANLKHLSLILSNNPGLGGFVRTLFIGVKLEDPETYVALIRVLRLVNAVNRVTISGHWYWPHWPRDLQQALITTITLPSLRYIALRGVGVPAAFIRYAVASYTEVALQASYIDSNRKIKLPAGGRGQFLESLALHYALDNSPNFHTLMLSDEVAASLARLRRLEIISSQEGPLNPFKEIISKYSDSLQHVTIASNPLGFALPRLSHLHSLTMLTRLYEASREPTALIPAAPILRFISSLPSCTPALQLLTLKFDVIRDDRWLGIWNEGGADTTVDEALLQLSDLRKVHFDLWFFRRFGNDCVSDMREKLPRASQAGVLSFSRRPISWEYDGAFR
ncbi:hypothetical protein B0H16DRAFT_1721865 [Mycena metata]|uniref:Uncharacterized protein n=1 Tax=Mycena metata TaxID=1033252 RepID=A0AAD7NDY7_9AGAR|nr:hypothetical protein B0H16DRAFT_1721865 [Mycena metata]